MCHNTDSLELLPVVSAVHHQGVGEALNDRALSFPEALLGISAGGVRKVDGLTDLNVVPVFQRKNGQHTFLETSAQTSSSFQ